MAKQNDILASNVRFYKEVMTTPADARKTIQAGRLKGYTDINPMWRIRRLTEVFGPAGFGWWTQNEKFTLVPGEGTHEMACFCELELVVVDPETKEESHPIKGIGGNKFIASERNGLYCNDEAYKSAYTDALSIACKSLGFSHDIYYDKDRTKYTTDEIPEEKPDTSSEKSGSKMKDTPEKPDEDQLTMVRTQLHETVKKLVTSMDEQQKNSLSAKIKAQLGTANYLKCNDLAKLSSLLTELSAA